jgi:ammonium transporter, Amt family
MKKTILALMFVLGIQMGLSAQEKSLQDTNPPEEATQVTVDYSAEIASLKAEVETIRTETNWLWTVIAGFLVFFMQAGFSYVEAGFSRTKNVVNILMKNFSDMSMGSIAFWLFGFSIMFGKPIFDGIGFGMPSLADSVIYTDKNPEAWGNAFLFFQMMFAATAATIVSGALAERTKFSTYLVFSVIITGIIYPIFGSFAWAGLWGGDDYSGFLEEMGFLDFAGSTVVHSVGAWAGLAGAIVVGPRMGKFLPNGKVSPILGHNMAMAALGVFILWIGWFGFNPGSTTEIADGAFALIAINTQIAAAAGAMGAMIVTWIKYEKPDIGLSLNGGLAGLVAITAPCDAVSIGASLIIGLVAGVLVVFSVLFFDMIKVDDPVGVVSVHGICGVWGTLAVGIFNVEKGLLYTGSFDQLLIQAIGVGVAFVWAFFVSLIIFYLLKWTMGIRVSEEEEIMGLDIFEHGNEAYPLSK